MQKLITTFISKKVEKVSDSSLRIPQGIEASSIEQV